MKKSKSKKIIIWISIILIVTAILISPIFAFVKSVFVMSIYSASEKSKSLLNTEGIIVKMPGGLSTFEKDWYPLVITYNADGFSNFIGEEADLTILYNFGAFDNKSGHSLLYDTSSDYHGAFYGAYAVRKNSGSFGYDNNKVIDAVEMSKVFKYDMQVLVLESIGCKDPIFEIDITDDVGKEDFLGFTWDVIDANIITNSPVHRKKENHIAYIQYGKPSKNYDGEDFFKYTSYGRIYAKYLEEHDLTLCFYIISPNKDVLEKCEEEFIKKSKIEFKK